MSLDPPRPDGPDQPDTGQSSPRADSEGGSAPYSSDAPAVLKANSGAPTATRFFLRGLAISLPTILTIVIVLWILRGIDSYIIYPATSAVKWVLAKSIDESIPVDGLVRLPNAPRLEGAGNDYLITKRYRDVIVANGVIRAETLEDSNDVYVPLGPRAVPYHQYRQALRVLPEESLGHNATTFYMEYSTVQYFKSLFHLSLLAVLIIIVVFYFLGRFVTARLGHWIVNKFESGVLGRVPVVRSVYGSVKQVTDFLFSEQEVEYRRVVAIEYPRRGVWSLGLVTGDSMLDIATAIGEPCVTVLIPSSPMPMTGYTMTLPRSEVLDLHVSVEQAMQFCISCGVLVPPNQKVTAEALQQQLSKRFTEDFLASSVSRKGGTSRGVGYREDEDQGQRPIVKPQPPKD